MWIAGAVVDDVDRLVVIRYVGQDEAWTWNKHRHEGELRMFTGWMWVAKRGGTYRQGLRSKSAAYRDAWYELVQKSAALALPRLHVVRRVA